MDRRKRGISPRTFLVLQLLLGILLLMPIEGKNSLSFLALGVSFLGIFIAVYSASETSGEKNKWTLTCIAALSLLTIVGIMLTGVIQLITTSMP